MTLTRSLPAQDLCAALREDPIGFLAKHTSPSMDLVHLGLKGEQQVVFVQDPWLLDQIFRVHHAEVSRGRSSSSLRPMMGDTLTTLDGEAWVEHKKRLQPTYSRNHMGTLLDETLRALQEAEVPSNPILLQDWADRLVMRVVERSWFGVEAGRETLDWMVPARFMHDLLYDQKWNAGFEAETQHQYDLALGTLQQTVQQWMNHLRPGTLFDGLRQAYATTSAGAPPQAQLHDEIMVMLVGAIDIANLISFLMHLLARHPDWQEQVRQEVEGITHLQAAHLDLSDFCSGPSSGTLPRLRAVVDETLRLYPQAWMLTREVTSGLTDLHPDLHPGTLVVASPFHLHRQASFWPHPEQFDPSRFLQQKVVPLSYVPFGYAPRQCIGKHLSLFMGQVVLVHLLKCYRWEEAHAGETRLKGTLTLELHHPSPLAIWPLSGPQGASR